MNGETGKSAVKTTEICDMHRVNRERHRRVDPEVQCHSRRLVMLVFVLPDSKHIGATLLN